MLLSLEQLRKTQRILFFAVGALLLTSAATKWHLLHVKRSVDLGWFLGNLSIPMYNVLWVVLFLESALAGCAFFVQTSKTLLGLIYLAGIFSSYRIVIYALDIHAPCSCMGDFPQLLGMGKGAENILSWMLYGTYILLLIALVAISGKSGFKKEIPPSALAI